MQGSWSDDSLKKLETALAPVSDAAKVIRSSIADGFLEPPDLLYMAHVHSLIQSIASGKLVPPDYGSVRSEMQQQRIAVEDYRLAMNSWAEGWRPGRAEVELLVQPAVVDEVYKTLGEPNDEKKVVVRMVVDRLDPAERDLTRPNEIRERLGTWEPENPKTLEEKLFHEVTRLDLGTWKIVPNIRRMIVNIGAGDRVKELHCWVGTPEDIPELRVIVRALGQWLDSEPPDDETRQIVAQLGRQDAYKEKKWLAATLMNFLNVHATDTRVPQLTD